MFWEVPNFIQENHSLFFGILTTSKNDINQISVSKFARKNIVTNERFRYMGPWHTVVLLSVTRHTAKSIGGNLLKLRPEDADVVRWLL